MQPIIHKFADYQVKLYLERGDFIISVSDENGLLDSFIETEDDQAALQFEQAVYNLHTANDDDEYHLPLMDFSDEDQFQILGELSYQNYCNCNCNCKGEPKMEIWKDSTGEVAEIYPLEAVADWQGQEEEDEENWDGDDLNDEEELDFNDDGDDWEDENDLEDAWLHDQLEDED